ncbi:histidine phosphatase family protein [Phenylobacterium montanum]|uniref:Histidine phosphatase family protein n=2 Tax=Phenylobacterium montanum TaxID=2823693 RepID=A0A975G5D9_9CAUL|nr:histidine phosphatase family protein [Caulobacter sp. S6]
MSTDPNGPSQPAPFQPDLAPPDVAQAKSAPGAIITVRHGRPNVSRKVMLNAAEYAAWWGRYEETGLKPGQVPPPSLMDIVRKAAVVLSSSRIRAVETAEALTEGRGFEIDDSLIEAPLPPPRWPSWLRLPPTVWGVIARFWWWFLNHHEGQESRKQAEARAQAVAARMTELARQGDVVIVAHGFFNTMIRRYLRRIGWTIVESEGGLSYWCRRRLVR